MSALRLQDAIVFLAVAGLIIPFMKRARVSPILGFLLCGILLGPHGLAQLAPTFPWLARVLITDPAGVRALAELGVVLLLFMIGLELSFERLMALRRLVFGLGLAQVGASALLIGGLASLFGLPATSALVLGLALSLSSTALVVGLLTEQGRFGTPVGRGSFAVLLAQDLAVIPILITLAVLSGRSGSWLASLAVAALAAVATVAAIVVVGRRVVGPLLRLVGESKGPEFFMAATLLLILVSARVTEHAGLPAALGAFLAGLLIAETEYRHEIEVGVEPWKGMLLGLFFISVGMGLDPAELIERPLPILPALAGLLALKAIVVYGLFRAFRLGHATALESALLLCQAGEFSLAVITLASSSGLIPEPWASFALTVVALSLLTTPGLARLARSAANRLERRESEEHASTTPEPSGLEGHVVIAGYGRVGRLIAEVLDRQQIPHVALDLDAPGIARLRAAGAPVHLGDARRAPLLAKFGLERALALVVTMDDPEAALQVVRTARGLRRELPILARARDRAHAEHLVEAGASTVIPEVVEAGLQIAHVLLEHAGLPSDAARDWVELCRAEAQRAYGFERRADEPGV